MCWCQAIVHWILAWVLALHQNIIFTLFGGNILHLYGLSRYTDTEEIQSRSATANIYTWTFTQLYAALRFSFDTAMWSNLKFTTSLKLVYFKGVISQDRGKFHPQSVFSILKQFFFTTITLIPILLSKKSSSHGTSWSQGKNINVSAWFIKK
jgi:hypothetical protein